MCAHQHQKTVAHRNRKQLLSPNMGNLVRLGEFCSEANQQAPANSPQEARKENFTAIFGKHAN